MRVVLKKEVYASRKLRLTEKPPQPQKVRNTLQKKKKNADANVEKVVSKRVLKACLVVYNRRCNVIVISMV